MTNTWDDAPPPVEAPPKYEDQPDRGHKRAWSTSLLAATRPHSEDVERQVLGLLLFDDQAAKQIIERLTPTHFYHPHHRLIFAAATRAWDDSGAVDPLLVADQLRTAGKLDEVGGLTNLSQITDAIATTAHLDQHLDTLDRLKRQRDLITVQIEALSDILDAGLEADEVLSKIKDKLSRIETTNHDAARWRGLKYMRWTDKEMTWIVDPFIGPQDVFFLSSDAGVGKTWFLVSMLLQVALGRMWLGKFTTNAVPALYVDFDGHGDGDALRRRFRRLAYGMGLHEPFTDIPDSFGVMTRFHLPAAINLYKGENLPTFKRTIKDGGYKLVFIDTFAAIHGSDNENDAGKMQICMNRLREMAYDTGAAFALAHHHRKPSQIGNDTAGSMYRGATSIKAGADSMLEMRREHSGIIRLCHAKPRHVKALPDFAASIQDLDGSVIIQYEDEDNLLTSRKDDAAKWILNDLWRLAGNTSDIPQREIIRLAHEQAIGSDKSVREALEVLQSRGLVVSSIAGKSHTKLWSLVLKGHD